MAHRLKNFPRLLGAPGALDRTSVLLGAGESSWRCIVPRTLLCLLVLALPLTPALASVEILSDPLFVWSEENQRMGLCTDVRSTGDTSVKVRVDGRPELGSVRIAWREGGESPELHWPMGAKGLAALHTYKGHVAGKDEMSVWIPTPAEPGNEYIVEVFEGDALVYRDRAGAPPLSDPGNACAAVTN